MMHVSEATLVKYEGASTDQIEPLSHCDHNDLNALNTDGFSVIEAVKGWGAGVDQLTANVLIKDPEGRHFLALVRIAGHQGHGGVAWQGLTYGHATWRCEGCGDTIFAGLPAEEPTRGA